MWMGTPLLAPASGRTWAPAASLASGVWVLLSSCVLRPVAYDGSHRACPLCPQAHVHLCASLGWGWLPLGARSGSASTPTTPGALSSRLRQGPPCSDLCLRAAGPSVASPASRSSHREGSELLVLQPRPQHARAGPPGCPLRHPHQRHAGPRVLLGSGDADVRASPGPVGVGVPRPASA